MTNQVQSEAIRSEENRGGQSGLREYSFLGKMVHTQTHTQGQIYSI